MKMFENYSLQTRFIELVEDLIVLFSFWIICCQTTGFLTAGGQYNQSKIVNFNKNQGIAMK